MPNAVLYLLALDEKLLLNVQDRIRRPKLNIWMQRISALGNAGILWLVCAAVLLLIPGQRLTGIVVVCAQLVGVLLTNCLLKHLVARKRPFHKLKQLRPLIELPKDWSFPSGHTTSSVSAALILMCGLPLYAGIPALIMGLMIAFSRMYVGVHYPSDILGGAVMGVFSAWAGSSLVERAAAVWFS
ncbi:MAG: phosphatase PAP2 family protein [Ruminococcus sp.]|nr:phosphatase PAP2 family protein [Ruminococcus sp.]